MKIIELLRATLDEENLGVALGRVYHGEEDDPLEVPREPATRRNPALSPTSGVIMRKDPMIQAPMDPMVEAIMKAQMWERDKYYSIPGSLLNELWQISIRLNDGFAITADERRNIAQRIQARFEQNVEGPID
jgi:hypothetical protein